MKKWHFFEFFPETFFRIFLVSGKLHSAKNVKKGPLGVFEHPFFCILGKNEGGTFWRHLQICETKSHQAEKKPAQKFLVMGGTRTHVILLGRHQKLS